MIVTGVGAWGGCSLRSVRTRPRDCWRRGLAGNRAPHLQPAHGVMAVLPGLRGSRLPGSERSRMDPLRHHDQPVVLCPTRARSRIASGGIGVGIMVVVPVVQILISNLGWRAAFIALAGMVLFGLLPVGLIVLRGRPEDLGQQVDGAGSAAVGPTRAGKRPPDGEWKWWTQSGPTGSGRCAWR